jgi:hypothetical protein
MHDHGHAGLRESECEGSHGVWHLNMDDVVATDASPHFHAREGDMAVDMTMPMEAQRVTP